MASSSGSPEVPGVRITRVSGSTSSPVLRGAVSSGSAARGPPDPASPAEPWRVAAPSPFGPSGPPARDAVLFSSVFSSSPRGPRLRRSSGLSCGLSLIFPLALLASGLSPAAFPRFSPHPDSTSPAPAAHLVCFPGKPGIYLLYTRPQIRPYPGARIIRQALCERFVHSYHSRYAVAGPLRVRCEEAVARRL